MAWITKDEVKAKNEKLKEINNRYGVKARFSGSNSRTLMLKVTAGSLDFIENFIQVAENKYTLMLIRNEEYNQLRKNQHISVNHYYLDDRFDGKCLEYLQEVYNLMLEGHYDDSDTMTDYFNCAWYNSIQIGAWDKPYKLIT